MADVVNLQDGRVQAKAILNAARLIVNRAVLGMAAGKSFYPSSGGGAERDIYKALGYTRNLTLDHYLSMYKRNEVAKNIVDAYPDACWKKPPAVREADNDQGELTEFDVTWDALVRDFSVYHYLNRADKLAGIGWFGILLLGFSDVSNAAEMEKPVETTGDLQLLYLRPYMAGSSSVVQWETDASSPRYGLPKVYQLRARSEGKKKSASFKVHHSSRSFGRQEEISKFQGPPQ